MSYALQQPTWETSLSGIRQIERSRWKSMGSSHIRVNPCLLSSQYADQTQLQQLYSDPIYRGFLVLYQ